MDTFNGFPQDLFDFLGELSKNNNREWFNANKDRYRESVVEPVTMFIIGMGKHLPEISKGFIADPRPSGGSMFRIYRDIRFSKDKRPYKENIGCQFRHVAGKDAHAPGFYVHIEPGNILVGGGIWTPPAAVLDKIRSAIAGNPKAWEKVITCKKMKQGFFDIKGESLKRAPAGYDPNHPFIKDLKRKSFFWMHSVKPSLATKPEFVEITHDAFKGVSPLMRFITDSLGLTF